MEIGELLQTIRQWSNFLQMGAASVSVTSPTFTSGRNIAALKNNLVCLLILFTEITQNIQHVVSTGIVVPGGNTLPPYFIIFLGVTPMCITRIIGNIIPEFSYRKKRIPCLTVFLAVKIKCSMNMKTMKFGIFQYPHVPYKSSYTHALLE
ncbi:hypothetical protein KCQ_18902 [Pectobacterium atrosepticum ICMP 1526]|nr:hypothetical protein EV46_14020 [Pectobacterium atrosepticum]KFX16376.1 hypothetical protein JV34_06190 [Pectobacterium atrosepticum]KFX25159.1 hypothetical protein KP24_00315 [Pectobacterium atrosepticum]KMK79465.1 hypothetical protein KCQ_18902 [Pectobacterium atrosepticum ICMP 1526]